jgi:hypothetical protein
MAVSVHLNVATGTAVSRRDPERAVSAWTSSTMRLMLLRQG